MKAGCGNMWTRDKMREDNRGTTMVSVVVSFVLLMIFVAGFFRVQRTSQSMMMNAKDLLVNNRELIKAYYLGETEDSIVAENVRFSFSGDEGSFFIDATLCQAQKEGLSGMVYYYKSEEGQDRE